MNTEADEEYKQRVLEPARTAGDQPPEDLRVRYRLREPLRPAEVAAAVKEVRQCWRRARGQLKYRKLIDRLEADHRALVPVFEAAAQGDLGPLQSRLRAAQVNTTRRRVEAKAWLLDAAGALGLLAPADLEGLAKTGGVPVAELGALAAGAGIEVRIPDPLPVVSPYQAYPRVREALDVLGHRHLPDFVLGGAGGGRAAGPMKVLDGFQAPGGRLDETTVGAVAGQWARRARDSSATHADTVLVALKLMIKQGLLEEFVRYDIAARLRERQRRRASERALLRYATAELGVDEQDARRLIFAIGREAAPESGGGPAGRLRELLDAGEVHAAALLAEALLATHPAAGAGAGAESAGAESAPGRLDEIGGDRDAAVLVTEVRQRVAVGTRLHAEAAASPDPDRAWTLLAEALRLVPDLPGAEEQQRRLPPRPVPVARATVDGAAVVVTWSATPSDVGEIDYQVVRSGPDGRGATEIAVTTDVTAHDEGPPANVPVTYAVVARRGTAAAAPAIAGPVVVRPEPFDVEVFAGDGVVTGRWRSPPMAARTLVTRDGAPVLAGHESFRDRDVRNGITYRYRLSAAYLDAAGREVATPGVWRSATPTAPPQPVTDLTITPDPVEPGRLLATFAAPAHGSAEIVVLGAPPPWPHGAVVPVSEVLRAGRRVAATPVPQSPAHGGAPPREGLRLRAPTGVLLAITVAGDTAAIGDHQRHVNLPPPRGLVAERRGGVIMVGFDWPLGVAEVEVTCRLPETSAERSVTVTKAAYDAQGGLRLGAPEGAAVEVAVRSTGLAAGVRVNGAAVTTTLDGRCLVRYDLYRTGPPWRRGLVVALTPERLTAGRPARLRRLVLIRSPGKVIPQREADGETIAAWDDLDLTGPTELAVPVAAARPGSHGADGPYWLRCFLLSEGAELADPPVRRLRFS